MNRGLPTYAKAFSVAAALTLSSTILTAAERIKTPQGDKLEISYKPAQRIIWAGLETERITDPERVTHLFFPNLLQMIAEEADKRGYPRFAVTGIFCLKLMNIYASVVKITCKLQAAPLQLDEEIRPTKKDDEPVYFQTKETLAAYPGHAWVDQFDMRSGIRGAIEIAKRTERIP